MKIYFIRKFFIHLFFFGLAINVGGAGRAQDKSSSEPESPPSPAALKHLSLEDLGKIEIVSVGRKQQTAASSAAALYVITQEDIHRSGVRTIPEALRLATGLEVAIFNNGTWAVSTRGFDITSANKIQVFMDGRSLYTPLFGGVFWDAQNTVIEDIDRIEVIRGPGAAMWGGNAVNGVINIITKSSKDTKGTLLVAGGGTHEKGFATARFGASAGKRFSYRLYSNYFDRDSLRLQNGADAKDPFSMEQAGFRSDADITDADLLTVQGDLYSGDSGLLNRPDSALHGGNITARWTHRFHNNSELQVQSYWDRTSRFVPQQFDEVRNTYDLDVQHHITAGEHNDIVWGFGYRISNNTTKDQPVLFFDPSGRHLALGNLFAQDEISFYHNLLHLTLGSKFENNSYTGWEVQPTARLAFTPSKLHTLWGAVSRAARIPTEFDEDLRITGTSPNVLISGSQQFRSEQVVAYEVGYRIFPHPRLAIGIATFFNDYDHLRSEEIPATGIPIILANNLRGHTYGSSENITLQVTPWWRMTVQHSNLQEHLRLAAGSTDQTGGSNEAADPRNQFALRSNMDFPHHLELDFWVRQVSALHLPYPQFVPSYTVFDARLGWHPRDFVEFSVIGRNLPGRRHLEFGPQGDLIRREVSTVMTLRF